MTKPDDLEILTEAFDRTRVWYRRLPEADTLRLASWFEDVMPAKPVRGLEEAGGDVMFFDTEGAYLGKGSWGGDPPAFYARAEEDARLAPRRDKERPGGHG